MNSEQTVRRFSFVMELGEFGHVASKQQLISSVPCGAELTLTHSMSPHNRFGYFEIFYDNKKIGVVPAKYTVRFFENGVLQKCRCTVTGLVPQGPLTVTCQINAEVFVTESPPAVLAEGDSAENFFPAVLPPKRKSEIRRVKKGVPPVYIGKSNPAKKPFYKNELLILLLCILFPPLGIVLLMLFSRRNVTQKSALISVGICVCVGIVFAFYTAANAPKPEVPASNTPEQAAMQFAESWQSEQWNNLLCLSGLDSSDDIINDIAEVFGAVKVADFQFEEIYRSENRVTYLLSVFIPNDKKKKTEDEAEFEDRQFTLDIERIGTVWYSDIKSLNHELLGDSLETLFACDSHAVIEEKPPITVYIDKNTMTYHNGKKCAPEGAPENTLSDALRKGYGPCGRCAR